MQIADTVKMIDRMSRSNKWDDPEDAARHLVAAVFAEETVAACDKLLSDDSWSQDRQPYEWLQAVRDAANT